MANEDPLGREHVPLPAAAPRARPERLRASAAPRPAAAYVAGQVVALAAALAAVGAGLWLGRGLNPEATIAAARAIVAPATAAAPSVAPALSAPSRPAASAPPAPVASPREPSAPVAAPRVAASPAPILPEVPSASRDVYSAAPGAGARALPEPPEAEFPAGAPNAAAALASQPDRLSAAATSALFNRSIGGFVPWKDQKTRSMVMSVGPGRGVGARGGLGRAQGNFQTPPQGAQSAPLGAPGAAAASGTCSDCNRALDALDHAGEAAYHPGHIVAGYMVYVGPCKDGYVYRVTNSSNYVLPRYLIGNDGEVWRTGLIPPGGTIDIRSVQPIQAATPTNGF